MEKISYQRYLEMLRDPDVPDQVLQEYSIVVRGETPFDIRLKPNPEKVRMTLEDIEQENALSTANGMARVRRRIQFRRRSLFGSDKPVLVSEGDSWFQFPVLIREVIDHLNDDYLIWSVGAAGDTAENMVFGALGRGRTEYMKALAEQKGRVRGFLFSAAGNDVIGEDPTTGIPVLQEIVKPFNGSTSDIVGHIDQAVFDKTLAFLQKAYAKVIRDVRSVPEFRQLPIFIHAYDYPFPYPWGEDDPRSPIHAAKDEWIGQPMAARGIMDKDLRRGIVKNLIDQTYDMLGVIAAKPNVVLVDCRRTLTDVGDWIDEIHGTSAGFRKIADKFKDAIARHV